MTIDAARAGLSVSELVLPLSHNETGRDLRGFAHRGRQLVDTVLAAGPLAVNHRGLRLPLVGWTLALRREPGSRRHRSDRPRRRPLVGPRARLPTTLARGQDDRRPQARRHPARRAARDAQALGRAPRRAQRQLPEPARHPPRPGAEGLPRRRAPRRSADSKRRLPAAIRSPREGDARRRRVERAGRDARLEFRESNHGTKPLAGDRGAGRADPPR